MTISEVCVAIEAETNTRTWVEATPALRVLVIKSIIDSLDVEYFPALNKEAEQAAKKVTKRKPRKAKEAPLTQHAYAEISGALNQ